jgi:hypothetical protein
LNQKQLLGIKYKLERESDRRLEKTAQRQASQVRFQVLTATSMKMAVFWDVASVV